MKKLILTVNLAIILSPIVSSILLNRCMATQVEYRTEMWQISDGGKLYDNWASTLMTTLPESTHPAYPLTGKKSGHDTWRCKECHGWDYQGKDGAYKTGAHYTGIIGIRAMKGLPLNTIKDKIRDKTHGYSKAFIPENALNRLAIFISKGQVNMQKYINNDTKKVLGNVHRGAELFQNICAVCHGFDGKRINFHADTLSEPEYIGTVANADPWETLHKIRNGQPSMPMVALNVLTIQEQLDILAYAQSLPSE